MKIQWHTERGEREANRFVVKRSASEKALKTLMQEEGLTRADLLGCLRQMLEIRHFEDTVYDLLSKNVIKGASHLYAGQEAVAVGAISVLRDDDLITSTHRGHGHCHARGDGLAKSAEEKQQHLNKMMAELCGRETGYCKGRGGSMHIADVERGNLGATGIVGGNIPVATGAALAAKMQGQEQVVLCFFGDGASNTGNFHESLNMASIWSLPVVYVVENNLYGMSEPFAKVSKKPDIASRAVAYGIPAEVVDGMDFLSVRAAVRKAVECARRGDGPTLLECKTYRWYGHSRSDPRAYRTREEERQWKARDPIPQLETRLIDESVATEQEIAQLNTAAAAAVQAAADFALNSPFPSPAELYNDVYAPSRTTLADVQTERELRHRVRSDANMRQIAYWQALKEALREELDRDPRVFLMGEDIGLYGGAYGVTRGLLEAYGAERVRDTPISEAAIGGAAVGAAMAGMRPVAEIMYIDFTPLAMDQLANQGAKNRYMFGGKTIVPMVIRTQGGAGRSIAAHHSQSLEALWIHFPGIYVVMPATPYDAKGLLKAAIRDDNPILFIEHKMLYKQKGPVPEDEYIIPLGVADVVREGRDVTVVAYSRMRYRALEAAELLAKEGISVEVIDPRTLRPLDLETIVDSVKKTGRLVGVTEAYKTGSFISELFTLIIESAFDYLDAPMVRVAGADVPVPMSEPLEAAAVPSTEQIVAAIRSVLQDRGDHMPVEVILPMLGETMDDGRIVKWFAAVGQPVQKGELLYQVETDKAVLDVEAPATGVLRKIFCDAGSTVPVLAVVALIAAPDEDTQDYGVSEAAQVGGRPSLSLAEPAAEVSQEMSTPQRIFASPRARKTATARGVDRARVTGSGPSGRIIERDVLAYLQAQPAATPAARKVATGAGLELAGVQGTGPGGRITRTDVEAMLTRSASEGEKPSASPTVAGRVPLTGVRRIVAERVSTSAHTTARVTLTTEVDATAFVQLRTLLKEQLEPALGFAISYTDILVAIAARALCEYPYMNARLVGAEIELLPQINIGVAVDAERGLLVPVIRDADEKGIADIARVLRELVSRARAGKTVPDDLTGGTFTLTNLGSYEIDAFTPIINLPECAILGVGRLRDTPAVHQGEICVRKMMVLSLTFDHRLVDGAPAARFLQCIKQLIEQPHLLLA